MNNSIEKIYSIYLESRRVFTDSRLSSGGGLFFALKGERFDGNIYAEQALKAGADYAIVDDDAVVRGERYILVKDVLKTLQQLANYHRKRLSIPLLAITGTNGKTTTKELITSVLKQKYSVLSTSGNLNNHIGVPLTLLEIKPEHEIAIIEMGANHKGEIEFLCNIAEPEYGIITNVGKAHLEGFGSFEGVKSTKAELYHYIANKGKAIFINADNEHLAGMADNNGIQLSYGFYSGYAQLKGELASNNIYITAKVLFPKGWLYLKSKLTGVYNLENILAAARTGMHFNVDPLRIKAGIENYLPDNNRSQVSKMGGATFLVDCYNANPTSMQASIDNFASFSQSEKVYVLGDMLELGDESPYEHQKIADKLLALDADSVFLIGKCFEQTDTKDKFIKYPNVQDFISSLVPGFWKGRFVLLKGSRALKLETILEHIS